MKGKRFSEEKIIYILKEQEARAKMSDLVRRHSVSEQSIYRWKSKYGVVAIVEHRLDGVISHLFNAVNIDALLANLQHALPGTMPLHLGGRGMHPQVFTTPTNPCGTF